MEKCWTQNPHDRPRFKEILSLLKSKRAALTPRRRSSQATVVERQLPVRGLHNIVRVRRETRPRSPLEQVNNSLSLENRGTPPAYEVALGLPTRSGEGDSGTEPLDGAHQ